MQAFKYLATDVTETARDRSADIKASYIAIAVIHIFMGIGFGGRFLAHSRLRWIEVQSWSSNTEHSPLPPDFYPTQQWMLAGASLVLASIFISIIACARARGGLILSGLADAIVSAVLITATVRQLWHIPASESACYSYQGPQSLQDMFVGLAKDREDKTNADQVCVEYHGSWVLALMISAATVPTALIGIFAPNLTIILVLTFHLWIIPAALCLLFMGAKKAILYLWRTYIRPFLHVITAPLRAILFVLGRIPAINRYRDRRAEKLQRNLSRGGDLEEQLLPAIDLYGMEYVEQKFDADSMSNPVSSGLMRRHGNIDSEPLWHVSTTRTSPTFDGVFSQERPLRALLSNCHFEDAWRLRNTSKTLRLAIGKAVMVSMDQSLQQQRLPISTAIRIMTCWRGSKSSCWGCGIQICTGCSTAAVVPDSMTPRTTAHLTLCEARCVTCYVGKMCSSMSSCTRSQPCKHHALPNIPASAIAPAATSTSSSERAESGNTHMLCSGCAAMTVSKLREKRERVETKELQWLARSTVTCGDCQLLLEENGPRFWACCECGAECTSDFHPPWRGKPDDPRMAHLEPLSALVKSHSMRSTF